MGKMNKNDLYGRPPGLLFYRGQKTGELQVFHFAAPTLLYLSILFPCFSCFSFFHFFPSFSKFPLPSYNEAKLAELRREEGSAEYRKRSGRMEKWKQVAMDAALDPAAKDLIPDKIEQLGFFFLKLFHAFPRWSRSWPQFARKSPWP